jgi:hypothetical protein
MSVTERRQNDRIIRLGKVEGKITRHPEDRQMKDKAFEGTVTDISALGIGLDTEADLPDTALVSMHVEINELGDIRKFKLDGEVRWRTPPGTIGLRRVGILLTGRPTRHFRKWQDMIFAAIRNRLQAP